MVSGNRIAALVLAVAGAAAPSHAAPRQAAGAAVDVDRIQQHIDAGRAHFAAGRYAEALAQLRAVEDDVVAGGGLAGFRWAIARCLEELEQPEAAITAFRRFIELSDTASARRRGEYRIRALEARMARERAAVTPAPSSVETRRTPPPARTVAHSPGPRFEPQPVPTPTLWSNLRFTAAAIAGLTVVPTDDSLIETNPGWTAGVRMVADTALSIANPGRLGLRLGLGYTGTHISFSRASTDGVWDWHLIELSASARLELSESVDVAVGGGPSFVVSIAETLDEDERDLGDIFGVARGDLFCELGYTFGAVRAAVRPEVGWLPRSSGAALRSQAFTLSLGVLFGD